VNVGCAGAEKFHLDDVGYVAMVSATVSGGKLAKITPIGKG